MTYRAVLSYGLIAGLSYADMGKMPPGLVCDLYIYRQRYDDQQHGIRRQKKGCAD